MSKNDEIFYTNIEKVCTTFKDGHHSHKNGPIVGDPENEYEDDLL